MQQCLLRCARLRCSPPIEKRTVLNDRVTADVLDGTRLRYAATRRKAGCACSLKKSGSSLNSGVKCFRAWSQRLTFVSVKQNCQRCADAKLRMTIN